jgi:alkylhydroperoxidase/carboxymuconolactone decarboxylase family protein YurZ
MTDPLRDLLDGITDRRAPLVRALAESVLLGPGSLPSEVRQAAARNGGLPPELASYVEKVTCHAYMVTDADVEALRQAGYSQDQILELTVSAALGAGLHRVRAAFRALQEAGDAP